MKSLGVGGQGEVGLFKHFQTGELFAVKFDPPELQFANILTECNFLGKYQHHLKGVIPDYITSNTINGRRYFIMGFVEYSVEEYIDLKRNTP